MSIHSNTQARRLERVIPSMATSDGAGVRLYRSIGSTPALRLDPFLMLDEFFSDDPNDYIAGFPSHPHRGFETVTYMLDGHMRHQDTLGNSGDLKPGDVQWMTAARGLIHSEMPQQAAGRMRGFQLWVNLPGAEKMKPAAWRDIPAKDIPTVQLPGGQVRVIAGSLRQPGGNTDGPVQGLTTQVLYLDLHLDAGAHFEQPMTQGHHAFIYMYEGDASIGAEAGSLPHRAVGVLSDGLSVEITAGKSGARMLLLAGKPLNEPVVQYGPFVMNSREEIDQALDDYRRGALTAA